MTQSQAIDILKTGVSVFLTGEPGSGKSYTVNQYCDYVRRCGVDPSLTASTGIAATHIGGMTIHSWSGIGVRDMSDPYMLDAVISSERTVRRVKNAHILIIDEISMLSAELLDGIDTVCRSIRNSSDPFGGLQVVLVGDFFQLPPISRGPERARFAYESRAWGALKPIVCYITEQHRQSDNAFVELLNAIRMGGINETHLSHLNDRITSIDTVPSNVTKLYAHNANVDIVNDNELLKIAGKGFAYTMKTAGNTNSVESLRKGCLSPERLVIKEGAIVMCTKNIPEQGTVNGSIGTVVGFSSDKYPNVKMHSDDRVITFKPVDWNLEENGKIRATVTQVPLRLAWAITIHKSQGMTMDSALMDLSAVFEYGQGYVALSRVKTLSGIHLIGIGEMALQTHPDVRESDAEFRYQSDLASDQFSDLPAETLAKMQNNFIKTIGGHPPVSAETVLAKKTIGKKPKRGDSAAVTLEHILTGASVSDIARARSLSPGTVIAHIEQLSVQGAIPTTRFETLVRGFGISSDDESAIAAAVAATSPPTLSSVRAKSGGKYSFEIIRLVRAKRGI